MNHKILWLQYKHSNTLNKATVHHGQMALRNHSSTVPTLKTKFLVVGYYKVQQPLYRISQSNIMSIMKAFKKIIPLILGD